MGTSSSLATVLLLSAMVCVSPVPVWGDAVVESARDIPVAYNVDVVVVGGSSAAVAAAVEAAAQGVDVFLAAERPYLGADLCGTYRLWLEPGEEPDTALAKALFTPPPPAPRMMPGLPFTYKADLPSSDPHKDSPGASLLADGKWESAYSQSVQYNGDVTIVAELAEPAQVERVHVMAYQRNNDIELAGITVFSSMDRDTWHEAGVGSNDLLGQGEYLDTAIPLTVSVGREAKYFRIVARKSARVDRLLLGEIVIEPEGAKPKAATRHRLPPTPMQIKHALDQALLDADVRFLFGCFPTDVLHDGRGNVAGIVVANRRGRQAIKAGAVIDATTRASVVRMAGCSFEPYPASTYSFKRIVLGGTLQKGSSFHSAQLPAPVQAPPGSRRRASHYDAIEYTLEIPMSDGSFASFAEAEQLARDWTWSPGQVDASDFLFQVPPDHVRGRKSLSGDWPGAEAVDLGVFRPKGARGLYVLGGCADVSRPAARQLLRPLTFMAVGRRVGAAAAKEITKKPREVHVASHTGTATVGGEIREVLGGLRPIQPSPAIVPSFERALPVLGQYDVVVVGGGTGGAPAGIAAARQGAKTLVVEYLYGLGGVGTMGFIGKYYYGYRGGFTAEMDEGVASMQDARTDGGWDIQTKMEWYRRQLRDAGADIWFGTLACGALVDGSRVTGVVVATPESRGVVLAQVVIDSTGNADVAFAAGAPCMFTDGSDIAVQGTGMPPHHLGAHYVNTDYTIADDGDPLDIWRTFVAGRNKYSNAYDFGQLIDTRERRRIVGDFVISPLDVFNGRTYPDTVGLSSSNFDTHGYTVHPLFLLKAPDKKAVSAFTPYRALLPKELDGILVTGLGISAHRDAMPILRMQPDIQNQGYAAGVAAAMAARDRLKTRDIDIRALQEHLVEKGNVPQSVLTDADSYPVDQARLAAAIASVPNDWEGLGLILAQPEQALPLLRTAYTTSEVKAHRLAYAHILGMLGDRAGADALLAAVAGQDWDEGWSFTGGGQFGASISLLDSLIIALGRTKDPRALEPILVKVSQLGPDNAFSHHRAVAIALEVLESSGAAEPLANLLRKPGMTGHAARDIEDAKRQALHPNPNLSRELSLRELILARALYRCGDWEGLGERILREYASDLRGHHARHAWAVLNEN